MPEGGGKVALQPDYSVDGRYYPDVNDSGKLIEYQDISDVDRHITV